MLFGNVFNATLKIYKNIVFLQNSWANIETYKSANILYPKIHDVFIISKSNDLFLSLCSYYYF